MPRVGAVNAWGPENGKSRIAFQRRRIKPGEPYNPPVCWGRWCRWYHCLRSARACSMRNHEILLFRCCEKVPKRCCQYLGALNRGSGNQILRICLQHRREQPWGCRNPTLCWGRPTRWWYSRGPWRSSSKCKSNFQVSFYKRNKEIELEIAASKPRRHARFSYRELYSHVR